MTRFPQRSTPPPDRSAATWIALAAILACAAGLLGLMALILPQALGVVLVAVVFSLFVALHYFTWGRWLMQQGRQSAASVVAEREHTSPPDDVQSPD